MQIKTTLTMIAIVGSIIGCSSSGKIEDYQRANSLEPMQFPDGVKQVSLPPLYPIPEVKVREEAFYNIETDGFVVPRPEPMSAEREQAKIKIQKVGDRRWILAEAPTSQVWPLAQNFLLQYAMGAVRSEPATGLVETDWVVFKDDESTRHQFQIRIEQGVRIDTTEIHILQRSTPASKKVATAWPKKSLEPAREEWVLNEMANVLAGSVGNRAASLLGQAVGGEVKAELLMLGSEPALQLRLDQSRGWATVARSLSKEGFRIWDEDSQNQVFFVQNDEFTPKRNWFLRLFMGRSKAYQDAPYTLQEAFKYLDGRPSVRKVFSDIPQAEFGNPQQQGYGYLVVLRESQAGIVVRIRDHAGRLLPLPENKKMLTILRRNLI